MLRHEIDELVALGPMPGSQADGSAISTFENALEKIAPPLTNEEAVALTTSFGPDDCFGLAWSLVHLIETAPGAVVPSEPEPQANEWLRVLWERSK